MKREILLLDVTAMQGANVCAAGIDRASRQQVRLADPTPTRAQLRRLGEIQPGDIIEADLQPLRAPTAPHVEDCRWDPARVRKLRRAPFDEIWEFTGHDSFRSVEAAFGTPSLRAAGGNSAWSPKTGGRSLATLRVKYVRLALDKNNHLRVALKDADDGYYHSVPFQDLRVRTHECDGCVDDPMLAAKKEFEANACLVRIGLTRPFPPDAADAGCWLQVTNIFARERQHFI